MRKYRYIFGPVPSRRFGRSLGVDLTPMKTCSFDCLFCQLGSTGETTVERGDYVPIDDVLEELHDWLCRDGQADVVTLSGSGEPTLHLHFGRVLDFVASNSDIPTVLLTNSTMLRLSEVRVDAAKASIVKVSLSAWDQESFDRVNRPDPALRFDEVVDGLKEFRRIHPGELRMEVFLVAGVNSAPVDVARIASVADEISPDLIQLNTSVRPPAEDIGVLSPEEMGALIKLFRQPTEVIADFSSSVAGTVDASGETILAMLKRRPCTAEHIAGVFNMHPNEVAKYVAELLRLGQIESRPKDGVVYYFSG